MSQVLAPIHEMMYNKILLQEDLTDRMLETAEKELGDSTVAAKIGEAFGETDRRPLAESIDLKNIHGWISGRIDHAEGRFAAAVTEILKNHPDAHKTLLNAAEEFGTEHAIAAGKTAEDAFEIFSKSFLNGMPCDRVVTVLENSGDVVRYAETRDMHSSYWTKVEGNPDHYQHLKAAFIKGMLRDSGITFEETGDREYMLRSAQ